MAADDAVDRLAAKILERQPQKLNMTYPSTAAGSDERTARRDGLPLPIGTAGQVVTVVNVGGGLLVPKWRTPSDGGAGTGGQYRRYMVQANPAGEGFLIMDAGGGQPLYDLADLE